MDISMGNTTTTLAPKPIFQCLKVGVLHELLGSIRFKQEFSTSIDGIGLRLRFGHRRTVLDSLTLLS